LNQLIQTSSISFVIQSLPLAACADNVLLMEKKPRYNALMYEVCVGRGWCGGIVNGQPSHVDDFIPESGPVTADQFVDWLFMATDVTYRGQEFVHAA